LILWELPLRAYGTGTLNPHNCSLRPHLTALCGQSPAALDAIPALDPRHGDPLPESPASPTLTSGISSNVPFQNSSAHQHMAAGIAAGLLRWAELVRIRFLRFETERQTLVHSGTSVPVLPTASETVYTIWFHTVLQARRKGSSGGIERQGPDARIGQTGEPCELDFSLGGKSQKAPGLPLVFSISHHSFLPPSVPSCPLVNGRHQQEAVAHTKTAHSGRRSRR
jgi:hypothetical protein